MNVYFYYNRSTPASISAGAPPASQLSRRLAAPHLLTGVGEPNAFGISGAGGDFASMEREHYHPFIRGTLGVTRPTVEELLDSGRLDEPLPPEIEAFIEGAAVRGDAPRFLQKLVNHLVIMGGRARIHQDRLLLRAGTGHPRHLRRFRQA
jgi:hypothetical protein